MGSWRPLPQAPIRIYPGHTIERLVYTRELVQLDIQAILHRLFCTRQPDRAAKSMGTVRADAINAEIGARIKRYRKALGYTQTELAKCLGVTFQQIQRYERSANRVSAGCLVEIAKALRIPVHCLLPGVATNRDAIARSSGIVDDQHVSRLICAFRNISDPAMKMSVITLTESLAE